MTHCAGAPACPTERMTRRIISSFIPAIVATMLSLSALGAVAQQGQAFSDGLAAYDAGDYAAAERLAPQLLDNGD